MGSHRIKHRVAHWAALALLSGASAVIVWSARTPEDARRSREIYEARHRACERLNAQAVRLRLAILHGGASQAERERFERINAEWLELYQWCGAWEFEHGVGAPAGDRTEAAAVTSEGDGPGDDGGETAAG
jgi:hypothetical protein